MVAAADGLAGRLACSLRAADCLLAMSRAIDEKEELVDYVTAAASEGLCFLSSFSS